MSNLIEVARAKEFMDGSTKKVKVQGTDILLAKVEGKYYAVDNRCPHFGGDLSKGKLDGYIITCPKHQSEFDLKDGHVIRWTDWSGIKLNLAKVFRSPKALKTYSVKEDGDKIFVEIK
ncbi:MAG: Rieske (2Fe-2S) protein [Methanotrichaceae archaeon]|nr:Rieske (2Fe-2S) protein [Methanotrichaceae archaeon]